ncbi:MAG: amino acid ABC transporter ATP-binding protein [Treponema sp.]|jgi:ABC-type polar amino acid transport system ATPase subunit|nr:amino acid ABC transporter ATP-binding protein [Treponema sp.]
MEKTEPVKITDLSFRYGNTQVISHLNLTVEEGDILVICGPSGSGKSTLLRCINQLEHSHQGSVKVFGREVSGYKRSRKTLIEVRKRCGMVFQHFDLFPHLTVLQNICIGPVKVRRENSQIALQRAKKLLEMVGLSNKYDTYPEQLSGGQKQRVAIARALAMEPEIMLFDEPTSALDPEMIKEVLEVMKALVFQGMTMIIVTHEMGFAREVATKVCFLEHGEILELSGRDQFFRNPSSERAKEFLKKIL